LSSGFWRLQRWTCDSRFTIYDYRLPVHNQTISKCRLHRVPLSFNKKKMYLPPDTLSENSRIWIYQSDRELNSEEQAAFGKDLQQFINEWTAHSKDLSGSYKILHNRFIVVIVDESNASASGCSIDKCVKFMIKEEERFKIRLMDRLLLAFMDDKKVSVLRKDQFEKLLQQGELNENTIVFNNLIDKKSQLDTEWMVPLKDSWHKVMLN
jgi:hypothetical protein